MYFKFFNNNNNDNILLFCDVIALERIVASMSCYWRYIATAIYHVIFSFPCSLHVRSAMVIVFSDLNICLSMLDEKRTFDAINHLYHEMCGKLYYPVETKHCSHQYREDRVQIK